MELSEIINSLGEDREEYFNAIAPPVIQTSNFRFRDTTEMQRMLANETEEVLYTRGNNPTVEILRKKLAALEHTEDALVFASGSAAIAAAVIANVNNGDHVICVEQCYSWTRNLLERFLPRFGVCCTFVDGRNLSDFREALQPSTRLVFLESPTTFMLQLQDIRAVADWAKKHGLITMIDNSCAGPLFQHPADMGVDVVIHSASKYIGGHSDVIAGIVCGSHAMMQNIHAGELMTLGAVISPWNAWLLIRSLRTLEVRMNHISDSALKIAGFLEQHPAVKKLHYPFSNSNPQRELAKQQMLKPTGLMTIELNTNEIEKVKRFCESLKHFILAVSWGGHESLVLPVFTTFKGEMKEEVPGMNLVRLYIGLEDASLLQQDLDQALQQIL
jgi:cystathionine beta-lyase/cystathionine gamma-synthase